MGRQMGIFSCSRALRVAVMAWVVLSFGPAPDIAAGTLLSPGPADLVRKSAEPFGVFAFRLAGEMAGYPAQTRRGTGATGALRRGSGTLRIAGGASVSRHRGPCESPRGTRPARRNQPRDQSRNPPDERPGPVRRD